MSPLPDPQDHTHALQSQGRGAGSALTHFSARIAGSARTTTNPQAIPYIPRDRRYLGTATELGVHELNYQVGVVRIRPPLLLHRI
jgi:hypothetical protein